MASTTDTDIELPPWKVELIELSMQAGILTFGSFKLKSNRISPYFVNCGLFCRAKLIRSISEAYAQALDTHAKQNKDWGFDVLFGPAYKGIPLCATTCDKLAGLDEERWGEVAYSYNRKEVKDHGEGGLMVGESLKGKRVVIIDDVITAGTAIREAISIIEHQGGKLVGIIVAVDRQEKLPSPAEKEGKGDDGVPRGSAIGEVERETGVPVMAVLTLADLIVGMRKLGREEDVKKMEEYYEQYKPTD
ncbi:hypothetical protein LTR85_004945 [Meristemomyces frigidus]|nr:hypothetical protein LTR85_004945 [Meristemomyces frigidus]